MRIWPVRPARRSPSRHQATNSPMTRSSFRQGTTIETVLVLGTFVSILTEGRSLRLDRSRTRSMDAMETLPGRLAEQSSVIGRLTPFIRRGGPCLDEELVPRVRAIVDEEQPEEQVGDQPFAGPVGLPPGKCVVERGGRERADRRLVQR